MTGSDAGAQAEAFDSAPGSIVDWERTGRRVRRSALVIGVLVLVVWLVTGLTGEGLTLAGLGGWVGFGLGAMVFAELIVVGTAAMQAERRAARQGERLSRPDVGLLPPRVRMPTDEPENEPVGDATAEQREG